MDPLRTRRKPRRVGRKVLIAVASLLAMSVTHAAQPWEGTGHLTWTTDYVNRGVSQTREEAAVQGAFRLTSARFFLGVWGSSTEYPGVQAQSQFTRDWELVYYGGFRHKLGRSFTAELQLSRYTFPGADLPRSQNYTEYAFRLDYRDRVSVIASYSAEPFALNAAAFWLEVTGRQALPGQWLLSASLGLNEIDQFAAENVLFGNVGVSRAWGRFSLDLRAHTTDAAGKRRFGRHAGERLVASLSMGF